jgi:hypothetical protein
MKKGNGGPIERPDRRRELEELCLSVQTLLTPLKAADVARLVAGALPNAPSVKAGAPLGVAEACSAYSG